MIILVIVILGIIIGTWLGFRKHRENLTEGNQRKNPPPVYSEGNQRKNPSREEVREIVAILAKELLHTSKVDEITDELLQHKDFSYEKFKLASPLIKKTLKR